jgi:hypothetical protein
MDMGMGTGGVSRRGARRRAAAFGAAALLGALCLGGVARGVSIPETVEFVATASVSPRNLPQTGSAPATLRFSFRAATLDGTHLPAISRFKVGLDRGLALALRRMPACNPTVETPIGRACGKARIGEGRVHFSIAFAEAEEIFTSGRVVLYNRGAQDGARTILAVAEMTAPTRASMVMTGQVRRTQSGRFGTEIVFSVPRVAGGAGSITALRMTIHGRRDVEGEPVELLTERCPRDRELHIRLGVSFIDGSISEAQVVQPCTVRG